MTEKPWEKSKAPVVQEEEVRPQPELNHRMLDLNAILPTLDDGTCEMTFKRRRDGIWTISVTDYPVSMKDRNEIIRQLKVWFRRYVMRINLDNKAKERKALEAKQA